MKTQLLLAILCFFCLTSYSQIVFENGYFIDESNQKTDCLIKNIDWRNNPTDFEYKLTQDEPVERATIQNIKEFGINGVSKFVRATVNMDRTSDVTSNLKNEREPSFKAEQLFLKVLIEGNATLYLYNESNLTRFFFRKEDSEINQLVYKRYLRKRELAQNNVVAQNNYYKQQLLLELECEGINIKDVNNIGYYQNDLISFFIKYNECTKSDYVNFEINNDKLLFNISLRPGLNSSNLIAENIHISTRNTDFGDQINFRFGIEAEFVLPFNKNKWSLIFEPTFHYFKSEVSMERNVPGGGT